LSLGRLKQGTGSWAKKEHIPGLLLGEAAVPGLERRKPFARVSAAWAN